MEMLKLLNANELVAQIICFLIFLAIMRAFLWKRFLGILDKRKEAISSEFKRIEEAKETLSRIKGEYEKKLAGIDDEAKAKIREATDQGRVLADELRARAELDSEKIFEKAKANIKDELAKAKEELKGDIVDLTIQAAEKIIQEKLSEESDRRLVEDFIKGIEKK